MPKKIATSGGVRVGKYVYRKSTRPGKKLMVTVDGKTIHFGDRNMQHYRDKTGIFRSLDHGDAQRRKNYLARSGGIRNGSGQLTKNDPRSPNYHAIRVLW